MPLSLSAGAGGGWLWGGLSRAGRVGEDEDNEGWGNGSHSLGSWSTRWDREQVNLC